MHMYYMFIILLLSKGHWYCFHSLDIVNEETLTWFHSFTCDYSILIWLSYLEKMVFNSFFTPLVLWSVFFFPETCSVCYYGSVVQFEVKHCGISIVFFLSPYNFFSNEGFIFSHKFEGDFLSFDEKYSWKFNGDFHKYIE